MPFQIIRNDITKVAADAIVNTANPDPVYGGGTDGAVYQAAGKERLLAERRKIGSIHPGEAAVTGAFRLPAKYIIHTVGPVWEDGKQGEFETLRSCYRKSLLLAEQLGCASIAFPLISTGVYGFPKDKALSIALEEIGTFLEESEMDVTLVVFDRTAFDLSEKRMSDVAEYIDENYVAEQSAREYEIDGYGMEESAGLPERRRANLARLQRLERMSASSERRPKHFPAPKSSGPEASMPASAAPAPAMPEPAMSAPAMPSYKPSASLDDLMANMAETFQERLFRMIDERGLDDTQVYKRANLSRKLFSKIRCNTSYMPRKSTAVALAVALRLNLDETKDLLGRAGLALSPSSRFDLIIQFCIKNGIYNILEINAILFDYDQPLLGC